MVTQVGRNVLANYLGGGWSALMGFAFIPLYIRYLGMEAYGLIAVFVLLQSWLALLDLGLTPALTRELARFNAGSLTPIAIRNLMVSVERVYFVVAILAALIVWLCADWLVTHWIVVKGLPHDAATRAVAAGGCVIALRWMLGLYRNSLVGLERQVPLNIYTAVFSSIRGAGVIVVLAFVSPTILAFFAFQGICFAIESIFLATYVRKLLPHSLQPAQFSWTVLRGVWRFAAGMMLIALLSILLTQVDKLTLLKFLSLKDFGYYALASSLAGALGLLVAPVNNAIYPRLTLLAAQNDIRLLSQTYHKSSQLMTLMLVPATAVLSCFSAGILLLWTRDPAITKAAAPLVSVLAIGTMLNGLMHTPYSLQLAYGWTRFMIVTNLISVAIVVPALYFSVRSYGAMAAAIIWTLLNAGYIFVAVPLMHRRLLPFAMWKWYAQDTLLPALAACGSVLIIRFLEPAAIAGDRFDHAIVLIVAAVVSFFSAALCTPLGRQTMLDYIRNTRGD